MIVEVQVGGVRDLAAEQHTDRTRLRVVIISPHQFRCMVNDIDGLFEKALCGVHIPLFVQHRVNRVAIPIDGSIEITPFTLDGDVCLIDAGSACLPTSLGSQLIRDEGCKPRFLLSHGLKWEPKAAFQEHLGQKPQVQFVPQSPQFGKQDEIGGIFRKVDGSAGQFIAGAVTGRAPKRPIARRGRLALLLGARGCTAWAVQGSLLLKICWMIVGIPQDGYHTGPCSQP